MATVGNAGFDLDRAVVVALGSNLAGGYDSCEALLEAALGAFPAAGLTALRRSRWWGSAAWPDASAPEYRNGIALVATELPPRAVLEALLAIETALGRTRPEPNAPRTLDLDLIAHGRAVIDEADLVVPHPRAHERLFVMGPLAEVAPGWLHPVLNQDAASLARTAPIARDARPVGPS